MSQEYIAVFEPDEGAWVASVPDLPGCFSDGSTLEQAKANIKEAIKLWIDTAKSNGWPIPKPQSDSMRIAV